MQAKDNILRTDSVRPGDSFENARSLNRTTPHNLEAEQALLGAILIDNRVLERVSNFLEPHHFFDPLHEQVYETAAKFIAEGRLANPITLRTQFETAPAIEPGLTVPQYLGRLAANATSTLNVSSYAQLIHDLASRRRAIIAGEDMVGAAYDLGVPLADTARHAAATAELIIGTSQENGAGWPEPDLSILKRNRTAAPPFPLDVLGDAGKWVQAAAAGKSAPVDYVALNLLVVAAGVIGAKRRVSPWAEWEEPSILWGISVGEPSSKKSPAADPLRDAVRNVELFANRDLAQDQIEYEADKTTAAAHRAAWESELAQAIKEKRDAPPMPDSAVEPKRPSRHRVWAVDCTTEQLARLLGENPAGLICFRDELAGLLGSFDRYGGSGSDRAFWLEAYGGRSYRYDRVGLKGEPVDVPFCAISLLGGVQPDRLDSLLLSGDDDGLAARPLYAWPDPVPPKRPTLVADRLILQSALQRLHDIPFDTDEDGKLRARVVTLDIEAVDVFTPWYECTQWEAQASSSGRVAGAIGKLDGITLRVAQTLEFLSWAWSGSNAPEPVCVSLQSVTSAIRLINEWVRPTLARVFAEAALPQGDRDARTVARWLLEHQPLRVNAKAARRSAGFTGPKDAKALDEALAVLVDANWLRAAGSRAGVAKGRMSKDFEVNPRVYEAEVT